MAVSVPVNEMVNHSFPTAPVTWECRSTVFSGISFVPLTSLMRIAQVTCAAADDAARVADALHRDARQCVDVLGRGRCERLPERTGVVRVGLRVVGSAAGGRAAGDRRVVQQLRLIIRAQCRLIRVERQRHRPGLGVRGPSMPARRQGVLVSESCFSSSHPPLRSLRPTARNTISRGKRANGGERGHPQGGRLWNRRDGADGAAGPKVRPPCRQIAGAVGIGRPAALPNQEVVPVHPAVAVEIARLVRS